MAYPTIEQRDACEQLRILHGYEEELWIEETLGAYGIVRMEWPFGKQHHFISPDGLLINWTPI